MIWTSFRQGVRAVWTYRRVVILFYLANLVAAFLVMVPFRSALVSFTGESLLAKTLAGRLDMDFFFEFLKYRQEALGSMLVLFIVVAVLYWVLELFLSAGAYGLLARNEAYHSAAFWGSAGAYFVRFIRIVLWGIPVFILFYFLPYIEVGIQRLIFGKDPYQNIVYWGKWIRVGLRFLGFVLWMMVLDYARIIAVISGDRRMRMAVWRALRFVIGHFGKTFLFAFLIFLVGIAVGLAYQPLSNALHAPSAAVIFLLVLLQQAYMLFRMSLRMVRFAGQVVLFRDLEGI